MGAQRAPEPDRDLPAGWKRVSADGPGPFVTRQVLIAPDGTRAVYALAQISGFGMANQSVQTVIVLVDLVNMSQQALGVPSDRLLRPILWTEDDSAILFADPQAQTTWKATIQDGTPEQIANGIYLGTVVSS